MYTPAFSTPAFSEPQLFEHGLSTLAELLTVSLLEQVRPCWGNCCTECPKIQNSLKELCERHRKKPRTFFCNLNISSPTFDYFSVLMLKPHVEKRYRRIADGYWRGAAVTKFPTKYFRIELCVESGVGNREGIPLPSRLWIWGASWAPPAGPGRSPGHQRIFGISEVHRTLVVERTVHVTLLNDVRSPESDMFIWKSADRRLRIYDSLEISDFSNSYSNTMNDKRFPEALYDEG